MTPSAGGGAVRVAAAFASLGGLLWWATGSPHAVLLRLILWQPREFDALLTNVAGGLAWLCLLWFGAVVALHLLALGSGGLAAVSRRAARHVAPRFVIGGARWLIGATLLAGPLSAGVATAAELGDGPASPAPAAVLNLDRPLDRLSQPYLDRPAPPPITSTRTAISTGAPTPAAPPTRSSPPATPPPRRPAPSARLLTGAPHREATDALVESVYVVQRGDNLWYIAARQLGPHATAADIARAWPRWYAANRAAIGASPQLIHPGLVLHAPRE